MWRLSKVRSRTGRAILRFPPPRAPDNRVRLRRARSTPRQHTLAAALLLAMCLGLASCRMPGTIRPTVKIGLVAPFEGRYRYIGYDVIYAARLAVREIHAAGGLGGYSVELVAYDDAAQPDAASTCAKKLAADPSVVTTLVHLGDIGFGGVLNDYAKVGMPLVLPASYDFVAARDEGLAFVLAPTAQAVADAILDQLAPFRPASVGLLTDENLLAPALRLAAQQRDLPLGPDLSTSEPGYATTTASRNPDAMILNAVPTTSGEAAASLHVAGWSGVLVGPHSLTPEDYRSVAGRAAAASCITPWPLPHLMAGGTAFVDGYREVSQGVPPGRLALSAYEGVWVIIEAIERTIDRDGRPSREGMAQSLGATRREGLLGTITFDADGRWEGAPLYACDVLTGISD